MRRLLTTGIAVAVGLGPGVLLPFMIALVMSAEQSDMTVLAVSVSVVLVNVVVAAVESTSVAAIGEAHAKGQLSKATMWAFTLRSFLASGPAVLIGAAVLVAIFSSSVADLPEFVIGVAIIAIAPFIGSASGVLAGSFLSEGRTFLPILSQGFRSLLPMIGVLVVANPSITLVSILYVIGEALRFALLALARARAPLSEDNGEAARLSNRGLYWQFASTSFTQANPVVDKYFLGSAPAGSITAYELADKASFAIFQVAYNFGLLQRIGKWSRAAGVVRRRLFRRDLVMLMGGTLALAVVAALAIWILQQLDAVPEQWSRGAQWAMIALFAMPFAIGVTSSMRYVVILNRTRWLLPISIGGVLVNAGLDLLFLTLFGPIGIVIASIPTRFFLFLGFQGVILLTERRTLEES